MHRRRRAEAEGRFVVRAVGELPPIAGSQRRRAEIEAFNTEHPHTKRGLAITPVKFGIGIVLIGIAFLLFIPVADIAAGMYAYSNVLAALIERGQTGRGKRIDVSMLESMVEWMSFPMYYAFEGAEPPPRAGAAHATIYPYGPFPTGDGKTVMLGLQNEREWAVFCKVVLQEPDLATQAAFATNSLRSANRARLRARIVETFARLTAAEVVARLTAR